MCQHVVPDLSTLGSSNTTQQQPLSSPPPPPPPPGPSNHHHHHTTRQPMENGVDESPLPPPPTPSTSSGALKKRRRRDERVQNEPNAENATQSLEEEFAVDSDEDKKKEHLTLSPIYERMFFLTKKRDKYISVGYNLDKKCQPILIFGCTNGKFFEFPIDDWINLIQNSKMISLSVDRMLNGSFPMAENKNIGVLVRVKTPRDVNIVIKWNSYRFTLTRFEWFQLVKRINSILHEVKFRQHSCFNIYEFVGDVQRNGHYKPPYFKFRDVIDYMSLSNEVLIN